MGYKENSKLIKIGKPIQGTTLKDTIFLEMLVNEKIALRNIYYDFDKWDILPESATELDHLVSLMKENPELKVELRVGVVVIIVVNIVVVVTTVRTIFSYVRLLLLQPVVHYSCREYAIK